MKNLRTHALVWRDFRKRPFFRSVATVATGTAASQAITMAFAPFITRLYGPEAYGLQGIFASLVAVLATGAALGYPTAIVLPRADADAYGIARLSLYIGLTITAVASLLLALFGTELLAVVNAEVLAPFAYLIPASMLASVLGAVLGQWLTRKQAFQLTATYGIVTTLLVSVIKATAGIIRPSAMALIFINTFGGLMSTALMYWGWRRAAGATPPRTTTDVASKSLRQLARQYSDFPVLRTPQNFINALSQTMPVLLLASMFGPSSAGQYNLAIAVLGLPSSLVAGSVLAVFYPRITAAINHGEDARSLIIRATLGMAATGVLPCLALVIWGPTLFELVFGGQWRTAGVYAQLLSVWLFFQYINKPAVAAVPALRLQGGLLVYEFFSTGSKLFALWLGFNVFKSDVGAVALFSLFGVAAYAWLILWVISRSGQQQRNAHQ